MAHALLHEKYYFLGHHSKKFRFCDLEVHARSSPLLRNSSNAVSTMAMSPLFGMTFGRCLQFQGMEVDTSIRAEVHSPSPPNPKNYRAWAYFYKSKKIGPFRLSPFGLWAFWAGPKTQNFIFYLKYYHF